MKFSDVRAKYPQYNDMSDEQLATALHRTYYADMDFGEFSKKIGYNQPGVGSFLKEKLPFQYEDERTTKQVVDDAQSMSLPRRIGSGIVGTVEQVPALLSQFPAFAAAGASYPIGRLAGDTHEDALQRVQETKEKFSYTPRSDMGRIMADAGGAAFEMAKESAGQGKLPFGAPGIAASNVLRDPKSPYYTGDVGPLAQTLGEATFEIGAFVDPLLAVKRGIARLDRETKLAEKTRLVEERAAEIQHKFVEEAKQAELEGFAELRLEAEPRTPYNMPKAMRERLEAELNPPVEQRVVGQGELFSRPDAFPDRMLEPRRGDGPGPIQFERYPDMPDRLTRPERVPEPPLRQDTTGPTPYREPIGQGELPFPQPEATRPFRNQRYPETGYSTRFPSDKALETAARSDRRETKQRQKQLTEEGIPMEDAKSQFEASQKPGFQRTAEEVMRAREWEQGPTAAFLNAARKKQGGFIAISPKVAESTARVFKHAFEKLEKTLPRFANNTNIVVLNQAAWDRYINKAIEQDLIAPQDKVAYQSGHIPLTFDGLRIVVNADSQFLKNADSTQIAQAFAHELTHGLQAQRGRFKEWDKDPSLWDLPANERPWEKQAIQAEHTLAKRFRGPKSQRGSWTPFASSKKAETQRSPFTQWKAEMRAKGHLLPDEVFKEIWERVEAGETATREVAPLTEGQKTVQVAEHIKGLSEIQDQYASQLTADQVGKRIKPNGDIGRVDRHVIGKIIQGRYISSEHPLLSWVSSKIHEYRTSADMMYRRARFGDSPKKPLPGTYDYWWKQLKPAEKIAVNRIGQYFNNIKEMATNEVIQAKSLELNGRRLSEPELFSYRDRVKINHKVLADINQVLVAEGKQPIGKLDNYWSPAQYDGAFLTFVRDARTKEVVDVVPTYLRPNTKKLQRELGNAFEVSEPKERFRRQSDDLQVLTEVLRHLSKDRRERVYVELGEAYRRAGFARHGLKRKGYGKAMGTEEGISGVRRYEKATDDYLLHAYNFIANRKLDQLLNEVNNIKEAKQNPNALGYALEAIDQARGGTNKTMEGLSNLISDTITGTISIGTAGKVNLPRKFVADMLTLGNRVRVTQLIGFWHPIQIAAQFLQPLYTVPQLMAMVARSGQGNMIPKIYKAIDNTFRELTNPGKDIQVFESLGALEATFKHDWVHQASEGSKQFKMLLTDHLTGVSTLTAIEKQVVRKPAALMFLNLLREMGYDKIARDKMEIYRVARELTDKYMVSNRWYEKPQVFGRSGLVGQAASPLMSFATTWLAMFREYVKLAGEGTLKGQLSKTSPLLAFMAINLMTAGMMGVIGVKEWDWLANLLNEYTDYNIPSGSEYIFDNVKNKYLRHGVLSTALDANIGATLNAPTLTGAGFPGIQLWMGVFQALGVGAKEVFGSGATSVAKRDALKEITPRFDPIGGARAFGVDILPPGVGVNWGDIERRYTPEGMPYATGANEASYSRTPEDWQARHLGTYTLTEASTKTKDFIAKQKGRQITRKISKINDKIMDNLVNDITDNTELIKKLRGYGMTDDEILTNIKSNIRARLLLPEARATGTLSSSKQRRMWELYQQLGGD